MRGKKIDTNFVATFVVNCIQSDKASSKSNEMICKRAREEISKIDSKIKEVEELKKTRAKLCDVLISFDNFKSADKTKDQEILNFYKIQHKYISLSILELIERNALSADQIINLLPLIVMAGAKQSPTKENIYLTIEQLIDYQVLIKDQNNLTLGKLYLNYKNFLNKLFKHE